MHLARQHPPFLTPVSSLLDLPTIPTSQFDRHDDARVLSSVTSPIPFAEEGGAAKRSDVSDATGFRDEQDYDAGHAPSESEPEDDCIDEEETRIISEDARRWSPTRNKTLHFEPGWKRKSDGTRAWFSRPGKRFRGHFCPLPVRPVDWSSLPGELILSIMHMIDDARAFANLLGVSTAWRALGQTESIYRLRCELRWGQQFVASCVRPVMPALHWRELYFRRCRLLSKFVVCSTYFKKTDKAEFKRKVMSLGGVYTDHFTTSVTHLVASRVGSCKYQLAMRLELPVVTQEWLEQCYWRSEIPLDLTFKLLPLSGCCITVTGLPQADRNIVEQTARMFGAEFSADLRRNRTTHLIAAIASGAKYDAAIRWGNIIVVPPKWFFDSVVHQMCMQEQLYSVVSQTAEVGLPVSDSIES